MTYTVIVRAPGGSFRLSANTREDADRVYGNALRDYPEAEVRLNEGEVCLVSATHTKE